MFNSNYTSKMRVRARWDLHCGDLQDEANVSSVQLRPYNRMQYFLASETSIE